MSAQTPIYVHYIDASHYEFYLDPTDLLYLSVLCEDADRLKVPQERLEIAKEMKTAKSNRTEGRGDCLFLAVLGGAKILSVADAVAGVDGSDMAAARVNQLRMDLSDSVRNAAEELNAFFQLNPEANPRNLTIEQIARTVEQVGSWSDEFYDLVIPFLPDILGRKIVSIDVANGRCIELERNYIARLREMVQVNVQQNNLLAGVDFG